MVLEVLRWTIAAALAASVGIAVGSWAVTTRRLSPFGWPARTIRRVSDPLLLPIERAILSRGGNPQHAPWWLLGGVIVSGIILLSLLQFIAGTVLSLGRAAQQGPRGVARFVVWATGNVMMLALIVRVIGMWLGAGRYNPFTRWSWRLTDWLVLPIQRHLPGFGLFDFSPLVAWLAIWLGQAILLSFL
ncbi:MAG: YggT family protein [Gemmatimonadales bacterium]